MNHMMDPFGGLDMLILLLIIILMLMFVPQIPVCVVSLRASGLEILLRQVLPWAAAIQVRALKFKMP